MHYLTHRGIAGTEQLGSQTCTYAILAVIARKFDRQVALTPEQSALGYGGQMSACFDHPFPVVHKVSFIDFPATDPRLRSNPPRRDLNITGRFDLGGEFLSGEEEFLKTVFRFKPEIAQKAEPRVEAFRKQTGLPVCSLHVRKYANGFHLDQPAQYYLSAIEYLNGKVGACGLLVFANSLEQARALGLEKLCGLPLQYVEGSPPAEDLCAMSRCDHQIIANSAFSSLAALLNPNPGQVICPANYIIPGQPLWAELNGHWMLKNWVAL